MTVTKIPQDQLQPLITVDFTRREASMLEKDGGHALEDIRDFLRALGCEADKALRP